MPLFPLGFRQASFLAMMPADMSSCVTAPRRGMAPNDRLISESLQDSGDADRPSHSADGVDLTLIRWMLSLTPLERLEVLQQHLRAVARLRDANPHL